MSQAISVSCESNAPLALSVTVQNPLAVEVNRRTGLVQRSVLLSLHE